MKTSIQDLCKQKNVSLPILAEHSGIDLKHLQAIHLGQWTPSANQRAMISEALDTPIDDIDWRHNTPVEHLYGPF